MTRETEYEEILGELKRHYGAERDLYERLLAKARLQFDLLSKGQQAEAARVVEEKGQIIEEIAGIEGQLAPLKRRWPEIEPGIGEEQRRDLADVVEAIRGLIESILEQDEDSGILLKNRAEEMAEEMQRLRRTKQATRAYRSQSRPSEAGQPYLLDRKE